MIENTKNARFYARFCVYMRVSALFIGTYAHFLCAKSRAQSGCFLVLWGGQSRKNSRFSARFRSYGVRNHLVLGLILGLSRV